MKTLVIFDETGRIYFAQSGSVTEPTGLHFLWVEIPEGKYVECVDVTDPENPVAVLKDHPATAEQQMRADIDYLLLLQEV